jgi:hypothetical protein
MAPLRGLLLTEYYPLKTIAHYPLLIVKYSLAANRHCGLLTNCSLLITHCYLLIQCHLVKENHPYNPRRGGIPATMEQS